MKWVKFFFDNYCRLVSVINCSTVQYFKCVMKFLEHFCFHNFTKHDVECQNQYLNIEPMTEHSSMWCTQFIFPMGDKKQATCYWKLPCVLPLSFTRNIHMYDMSVSFQTPVTVRMYICMIIILWWIVWCTQRCTSPLYCFSSASDFNFATHNWTLPSNVSQIKVWEADQDFTRANDTLVYIGSPLEAYISDLSPGKSYMLRVLAFSRGGDGKKSSPPWKFQLGE